MDKIEEKELNKNINVEENVNDIEKIYQEENISNVIEDLEQEDTSNLTSLIEEEITINTENIVNKDNDDRILENKESKKHNRILIAFISIFFVILFSTIFALLNINRTTIISGVSIKGIDVSGLTKEEAYNKIESTILQKLSKPFNLVYNDISTSVSAEQFGANFDISSSVDTAYKIGKENNILKDNFKILSSLIFKTDILPSFSYNEDSINSLALEIESNFPDKLVEPSYYIENNNLIISNGIDGVTIDKEILKLNIIKYIYDFNTTNENITIPVLNKVAKNIDIDTIYSEIYKEPKDAYYTKDPFTVYPHVDGIDFEISINEVKKILSEEKESYTIPLKITKPNITTSQIGTDAFPDLLGSFSTSYSTKNVNRTTNIKLASSKIDGIVILPGETFSYNTTVGKRTATAGFKSAAVYAGGEVTTGIGGGICQVSSTLYNSVLLSNLEIVERHNHGFNPGYVKAGTDATVSWGGPDFKFKNNRKYPIKVLCSNSGGTVTTQIFGLKEENDYEVEIEAYVTSYIPYKTITKQVNSLKAGQTKVIESGSNGCNSVAYRILKQNGNVVSKTLLSKDTYSPHNRIIHVGTKKVVTTPTIPPKSENITTTESPTISETPVVSEKPVVQENPKEPSSPNM